MSSTNNWAQENNIASGANSGGGILTSGSTVYGDQAAATTGDAGGTAVSGNGNNVTITATDLGTVDAASQIAVSSIAAQVDTTKAADNLAGQVTTTALAANTDVTKSAIGAVTSADTGITTVALAANNDIASKAIAAAQEASTISTAAIEQSTQSILSAQQQQSNNLIATVDSAVSQLGTSFSTGLTTSLNFLGTQEQQLQTATTNAISTVADKNQSETDLQTQTIQKTLITLVGVVVLGAVVAIIALKK